ncbi:MAG: hypothetical protein K2M68_00535 [Muribaculaceae bacterium]|nr:hypothetical protein [Muribaculaceae bacterium]
MKYLLTLLTLSAIIFTGCTGPTTAPIDNEHSETNAVYYWKTVFKPDSADYDFIDRHNVGRIYMRMFDVVKDETARSVSEAVYPNATIQIHDSRSYIDNPVPDLEYVPVVYVTLDALKAMNDNEELLAENIVTRVRNMTEYNELPNVGELQLDCDWTQSTEKSFFRLCQAVRCKMTELQLPWELSSTIRLHQLSSEAPPVDRSVLMVYNTGSFNNPDARNSIIDLKDVEPYLKRLTDYPLHLDIAYPTYSWQLLFRKRTFIGLTNGLELNDTTRFKPLNETQYLAMRDIPHNGKIIRKGDIIRAETSRYSDIMEVKRLIEQRLSGRPHSNILYHLDSTNLSNYTPDEIETLFAIGR